MQSFNYRIARVLCMFWLFIKPFVAKWFAIFDLVLGVLVNESMVFDFN